jgi:hypothetical protein
MASVFSFLRLVQTLVSGYLLDQSGNVLTGGGNRLTPN